ncbi:MAG TPA: N4-gp56 family major capsid protein [Candidatus Atribacteria bacterium]|nr:N4-gp56 family major capsid protein [Candidatus Atribacteria bacterium]
MAGNLNALAPVSEINTWIELANKAGKGVINPETFYSKQLLDTIRYDADQYVYFRLADEAPIQEKADKLMLRRWAPLQAHTVPLEEGVPPKSDKGSVEKYELNAAQYGRYMEFSDKVDFQVVDPVIAHYTREYSLVAMETLDLLARETLLSIANKFYAGQAANFEALTPNSRPSMADLRLIVLALKKALVKPRVNGRYHVIGSPEFFYDMISDPIVEKYMTINQTTKTMYDNSSLVPMFEMEFYETMLVPTSSEYVSDDKVYRRMYRPNGQNGYEYSRIAEDSTYVSTVDGYVKDARTGQDASYIPGRKVWDIAAWNNANKGIGSDWYELKAQHILIVGKDALTRTGLAGEGQAKMYVKQKGSSGVLDPIDQRQSIGFKINSVGFGSTRLEAVVDYICVPSQVNPV